jgi:hypothetical protein
MAVRSGRGARSFGGADEQASEDLRELADVSTMNMQLTAVAAAAESTQHVSDAAIDAAIAAHPRSSDAAIAASLSPSRLFQEFSSACSTFLDQARQSFNAVEPPPRSRDLRSPSSVSESEVDWIGAPSAATARSPVQVDRYGDGTLTTMRAEEQQDDLKRSVGETYVESGGGASRSCAFRFDSTAEMAQIDRKLQVLEASPKSRSLCGSQLRFDGGIFGEDASSLSLRRESLMGALVKRGWSEAVIDSEVEMHLAKIGKSSKPNAGATPLKKNRRMVKAKSSKMRPKSALRKKASRIQQKSGGASSAIDRPVVVSLFDKSKLGEIASIDLELGGCDGCLLLSKRDSLSHRRAVAMGALAERGA